MTSKSSAFEREAIATIVGSTAVPLYDETTLTTALLAEDVFKEFESIDLDYYYNSDDGQYEALLTIIGKDPSDLSITAFQADLVIDEEEVFIMNLVLSPSFFNKHSCTEAPCSSCSFTRNGFLNLRITGCVCNDNIEGNKCNHGINNGGAGEVIKVVEVVTDVVVTP